jgi:TetR/AcrR family transcriptional regulator, cholesterol catabolism regulator
MASGIAKRRAAAKTESSERYLERRRKLIKAAAAVFQKKGLAATSVNDIAQAIGVDRASLYYYVGSKEELFAEVVLEVVTANVEMAEEIRDGEGKPVEKLERLVVKVLESYAKHYPHIYVYLREDLDQLTPSGANGSVDVLELRRRFDRAMTAIIEEGIADGSFRSDLSPRVVTYGLTGMINWTHRWFDPDGPISGRELGKEFAMLALEGLVQRKKK